MGKVPDTVGVTGAENPWSEFNELLIKLTKRELTGNAAHDAIEEMAYKFEIGRASCRERVFRAV